MYAGQSDPAWSIPALWRQPGELRLERQPGPKRALSLDEIVRAATEIADRDGLAGLSMRAVGERLGRTAMSLYTYVPGKNELIDVMYDGVHAELPMAYDLGEGWRSALTSWAGDLLDFHVRHPWTVQVSFARPVLGPHEQAVLENLATILRSTGLPAARTRPMVTALYHLIRGSAQTITDARRAAEITGTPDEQWWSARSARLLEEVPDFGARFPATVWLNTSENIAENAQSYDLEASAREAFAGGRDLLLNGLSAMI
ncbi:TetR/AcrR family transcriptional regulator C-terminal domain-containing protein [Hamadaea sp.]|uniref:TetR/AcrR family transcriptional regulator n=1 Tax=Hamadaea sp. TaxID=2024425 RepID=UPI0025C21230|nr:TetR/AcrR family transcriptional regulator C-terminal domain-containing protein [Hamadaea sp.]